MKKISKIHLLLIIILLGLIGLGIINQTFLNFSRPILSNSTAKIEVEENKLIIRFDIAPEDKENAKRFSQNLGTDMSWLEGVSIELDEQSIAKLKANLPATVSVKFNDKEMKFSGGMPTTLNSALPSKDYILATGSGVLSLKVKSDKAYQLEIKKPELVLHFATESGKLYISPQLRGLFPYVSKIDTIMIDARSKNISGRITLN